jgi:ribosomal protein L16 Arg81 hydroxylase
LAKAPAFRAAGAAGIRRRDRQARARCSSPRATTSNPGWWNDAARSGIRATGPFEKVTLGKARSTLLVSGVNLHLAAADALLRRFAFVPQARLDDVMVSYATPGGGVGPHVDSYDVFLLQGPGRRRWRVVQKEYIAHPGDLLYLPPGVEHDGVALEECYTYSIGFRAPRGAELGAAFLDWLHERGLPGRRVPRPAARAGIAAGAHPARNVAVR